MATAATATAAVTCWCFGASLTEGLTYDPGFRQAFRPYARYMEELSAGAVVGVATGHSGATTTQLLEDFMEWDLEQVVSGETGVPRYVAILGGTNDLGHALAYVSGGALSDDAVAGLVKEPAANLLAIADAIRSHPRMRASPPHVFIITVPPLGGSVFEAMGRPAWDASVRCRHALSSQLRRSVEGNADVDVVDSWAAVATPHDDPARPDSIRPEFDCGDGIHFSDAGYKALSKAVSDAAVAHLASAAGPRAAGAAEDGSL